MEPQPASEEPPVFRAELRPHRSLSPRGFLLLMLFVGGVSFSAGMVFLLKGAWPVLGFFGLDVLAIYIAFRISYSSGRAFETIELYPGRLTIARHRPYRAPQSWTFEPHWLRVELVGAEDAPQRIALRQRHEELYIGDHMPPAERPHFAQALRDALGKARSPGFA